MLVRKMKSAVFVLAIVCLAILPGQLLAQGNGSGMVVNTPLSGGLTRSIAIIDLDLQITGPNGAPIEGMAVVTMTQLNGQIYRQSTAKAGYLRMNEVPQSEYNVLVVAPGFGRITKLIDTHAQGTTLMKVTLELQPAPEGEDAFTDTELAALAPKAQKAIGKAIESLRSNKMPEARSHLETAYRVAPTSAEVSYLFGVYSLRMSDRVQAKSYWTRTLELYPRHFRALLSLSQALLDENKPGEALPYLFEPSHTPGELTRSTRMRTCGKVRQTKPSNKPTAHWNWATGRLPLSSGIWQQLWPNAEKGTKR